MKERFVVVHGSFEKGFSVYGPLESRLAAEKWVAVAFNRETKVEILPLFEFSEMTDAATRTGA